jgi:hypothetical protein
MSGDPSYKVGSMGHNRPPTLQQVDSDPIKTGQKWKTIGGNKHTITTNNTKPVENRQIINVKDLKGFDRDSLNALLAQSLMSDITGVTNEDGRIEDNIPPAPPPKDTGRDGLKLFKDRKLSMVRGTGAFVGAGAGMVGAAAALKFAAIGAAIGTAIFPGIGTGAGALVGLAVGMVAGGSAGALVGGLIGHFVGKNQAAKVDVDSLVKEYGPGSSKYEKIVSDGGYELEDTVMPQDEDRIGDAFRAAIQNRVNLGRPFGENFISTTLLALRSINSRLDLGNDDKSNINKAFLRQLNIPGRATPEMTEATVDALTDIYATRNLEPNEKQLVAQRLVEQLEAHAKIGQPVSPNETQSLAKQYIDEALSAKNESISEF